MNMNKMQPDSTPMDQKKTHLRQFAHGGWLKVESSKATPSAEMMETTQASTQNEAWPGHAQGGAVLAASPPPRTTPPTPAPSAARDLETWPGQARGGTVLAARSPP